MQGHHDGAQGQGVEVDRAREHPVFGLGEHAVVTSAADEQRQLLGAVNLRELVLGVDSEQVKAAVGHRIEQAEHRSGHPGEPTEGQRQQHRRPFGVRDGPRLRGHLADDHVQEHHDAHGQHDRHHGGSRLGESRKEEDGRQQVGHGGLGHRTESEGAQGDAELGAGEHEGEFSAAVHGGGGGPAAALGENFKAVSLAGDEGELGGHEEGVEHEQHDGEGQRDDHRLTSSSVRAGRLVRPDVTGSPASAGDPSTSTRTDNGTCRSTSATVSRTDTGVRRTGSREEALADVGRAVSSSGWLERSERGPRGPRAGAASDAVSDAVSDVVPTSVLAASSTRRCPQAIATSPARTTRPSSSRMSPLTVENSSSAVTRTPVAVSSSSMRICPSTSQA